VNSDVKTTPILNIIVFAVGELIDAGAGVDGVDHRGNAPLHYAVQTGRVELVKLLVVAGADTTVKNTAGRGLRDGCFDARILDILDNSTGVRAAIEKVGSEDVLKKVVVLRLSFIVRYPR
jgi:ankyrin repeat protein